MINKSLIALAFGGLAIGMTEFTMMGILPDISANLNIDIPTAGFLIAVYAIGVVVGAPILVLFTGKYPPKKVLLFLMVLFVIFNALFAIAPDFNSLIVSRFMSGLPHGAFFGVGSVVASKLAEKGKEAQAISIMFTGMTIANLAGVPIGTYIGHYYSWRYTYIFISLLGLVTFLSIYYWLPKIEANENGNLFGQLNFFKRADAWLLVAIISIGTGGLFAWISYIAPMATNVSQINPDNVPLIMVLVGLGMFFGNLIGGKLADTISPTKAAILCFSSMVVCLITVYYTAHIGIMAYIMSFVTGLIAFTIGSPLQMMLITTAKGAETLAAAAGQASFNIGNTLGAFFGGIPIAMGFGYNTPVLIGVAMASVGAILSTVFLKVYRKKKLVL